MKITIKQVAELKKLKFGKQMSFKNNKIALRCHDGILYDFTSPESIKFYSFDELEGITHQNKKTIKVNFVHGFNCPSADEIKVTDMFSKPRDFFNVADFEKPLVKAVEPKLNSDKLDIKVFTISEDGKLKKTDVTVIGFQLRNEALFQYGPVFKKVRLEIVSLDPLDLFPLQFAKTIYLKSKEHPELNGAIELSDLGSAVEIRDGIGMIVVKGRFEKDFIPVHSVECPAYVVLCGKNGVPREVVICEKLQLALHVIDITEVDSAELEFTQWPLGLTVEPLHYGQDHEKIESVKVIFPEKVHANGMEIKTFEAVVCSVTAEGPIKSLYFSKIKYE